MRTIAAAAAFSVAVASDHPFDDFKQKYNRKYANHDVEWYRRSVFHKNLKFIEETNAKELPFKLGVTDFADLTFDEFKQSHLSGYMPSDRKSSLGVFRAPVNQTTPDSVDWTQKGAVTPVKNQAQCGSCWSFSTTGGLEGALYIKTGKLTSLSEQNILDCDKGGNKCQGGSMDQAFDWVKENGLMSEADDGYKCQDQASSQCKDSTCPTSGAKFIKPGDVTGHTDVDQTQGALEAAVAQQPVSIAIEADKPVFQHYKSGVLTSDECGSQLDHGVLAVGYGTDGGQKYWKVKNSWGTSFGEQGYIRLARGSSSSGGECGIRKGAVFPTLASELQGNHVIV